MSHYEPNINRIKIILFFSNCLAFMKATGQVSYRCQFCHCMVFFGAAASKNQRIKLETANLCFGGSRAAISLRRPRFASDNRILLQTAAFCFRQPHFASDSRVLLQTAVFCFRQSYFASDSRNLLWIVAFCFGQLRFASDSCVLPQTAAFCLGPPRFASDHRVLFRTGTFYSRLWRQTAAIALRSLLKASDSRM